MSKAYEGQVTTEHVKLGAQRLLLAPIGVTAITARIADVTTPPTGWRDCGSLADNKASITSKKEIFSLKTGLPETTKMQEIVAVDGQIKAELNEWSFSNIHDASGRPPIINTLDATAKTTVVAAGSTRKVINVTDASNFAAGDTIVADVEVDCVASSVLSEIKSINANAVTLTTALPNIPANGVNFQRVTKTVMAYGDTGITKVQAALVFDAKDGTQVIHYMPEAAMLGDYSPTMTDVKKQVTLPITLEGYGVQDTEFNKLLIIKILTFAKNQ